MLNLHRDAFETQFSHSHGISGILLIRDWQVYWFQVRTLLLKWFLYFFLLEKISAFNDAETENPFKRDYSLKV